MTLQVTTEMIVQALQTPGSLDQKAKALGAARGQFFHARARVNPTVREALHAWKKFPRCPYPTLITFQPGEKRGDWEVLGRLPRQYGDRGSAYWQIRHTCGRVRRISGSEFARRASVLCSKCRFKRYEPGEKVGGWQVIKRTKPTRKGSRSCFWEVRHVACGSVRIFTSTELRRQADKECQRCRRSNGYHRTRSNYGK